MERFFQAFDQLRKDRKITSITAFCEKYQIDKRHLYTQRKEMSRGFFEVGWLVILIRDFGVSADWLLTGSGSIYNI